MVAKDKASVIGRKGFRVLSAIVSELSSRVIAILAVSLGAYLVTRILAPPLSIGVGLMTWGALSLLIGLRNESRNLYLMRKALEKK